jgi:hypothetical protein
VQWLNDKDGNAFALDAETWMHIQEFHPEITDIALIESALLKPDWIVRSNWDSHSVLYYQRIRPRRFRAVVVDTANMRIKTTLTTQSVKEGEILWPKLNRLP